jgi:membrane fusion protein (multidrug efflux system)
MAVVTALLVLSACGEGEAPKAQGGPKKNATPVSTVNLQSQRVNLIEEMPGRTVAYRKTDVRPQVDGIIKERNFEEGAFVEAGQQLYLINQDVYLAELAAAKAELAKQNATLSQAEKTLTRYKKLVKTQTLSQQKYDDAIAEEAQAKAAVSAARAKVDRARINVEYTSLKAPISGQIGASAYNEGSLVTGSQSNALSTITQLDPIYVDVVQAGGRLLRIKQEIQSGRLSGFENNKIDVALIIDGTGTEYPLKGTLKFSDVSVNETTGTVRLRAVFPNPDRVLLPGMFVRGLVRQGALENAFLVPQKATMRRPDGSAFVYTVVEGKATVAPVTIEQAQGKDWVVTSGLRDGVEIIVDGLQRIGPGAPVLAQPVNAPKAAK